MPGMSLRAPAFTVTKKMKGHDAGRRKYISQNIASIARWPIAAIEPSAPT
jgi:hypothetical protein